MKHETGDTIGRVAPRQNGGSGALAFGAVRGAEVEVEVKGHGIRVDRSLDGVFERTNLPAVRVPVVDLLTPRDGVEAGGLGEGSMQLNLGNEDVGEAGEAATGFVDEVGLVGQDGLSIPGMEFGGGELPGQAGVVGRVFGRWIRLGFPATSNEEQAGGEKEKADWFADGSYGSSPGRTSMMRAVMIP